MARTKRVYAFRMNVMEEIFETCTAAIVFK